MIHHNIGNFPDGTIEAIMAVYILKGGKIIRTETGSTPIKWKNPPSLRFSVGGGGDYNHSLKSIRQNKPNFLKQTRPDN